jgi:polysaccharide deacetylase family protein (PEP-CTERM system associated)
MPLNAMSVDVEDYFQVEAFRGLVRRSDWAGLPHRVESSTGKILDLMAQDKVKGTFFILGWIAERFPQLVRRIAEEGHEIASHGSMHERADRQSRAEFREDVRAAKHLLEDISGAEVKGYRAPTFSIRRENWWAYETLADCGYRYSSSIYPIRHDLYGMVEAPRSPFRPVDAPLIEIPISTVRLFGRNFPCSGGGYFRLLPYGVSKNAMRYANVIERRPCIFYCHPWEFDPEQPRVMAASAKAKFRHYTNIPRMSDRFARLLGDFKWDRMDKVFLGENESAYRRWQ